MSQISVWSTTPSANGTLGSPPIYWPEGQAPSTVNDCARQMMSAIRTQWNDAQWFDWGYSVSRIAGNKFRVTSATASTVTISNVFVVGGRVKLYDTSTLYGTVTEVSASATSVNVTFTPDSGSLTSSFTSVYNSIITPNNTALPIGGSSLVNSIVVQVFTSSGTYTPTAGMKFANIECVGSGGGGGGTANSAASTYAGGGGGGGGGYSRKLTTAATVGVSQVVTIGAAGTGGASGNNNGANGGDTSVGTICVGKGGGGGVGSAGTGTGGAGAGGTTGTGDFTVVGEDGEAFIGNTTPWGLTLLGVGGNAALAFGIGGNVQSSTPSTGGNGTLYGGGGAGGSSFNGNGAAAGGNGATGIVIITEYISV